jgi:hypothetical protein
VSGERHHQRKGRQRRLPHDGRDCTHFGEFALIAPGRTNCFSTDLQILVRAQLVIILQPLQHLARFLRNYIIGNGGILHSSFFFTIRMYAKQIYSFMLHFTVFILKKKN